MIRLPHDPALPGLSQIADSEGFAGLLRPLLSSRRPAASRLTGLGIQRVRHREGERAIVQCELDFDDAGQCFSLPASIWMFAGNKAEKRAGQATRTDGAAPLFEPVTKSLVYIFPQDPHVLGLAAFVHTAKSCLRTLVPHAEGTVRAPELVRFRPGLGATFRWTLPGGDAVYVKVLADGDVAVNAARLNVLRDASGRRNWDVPEVTGFDTTLPAIAIGEMRGTVYADLLSRQSADAAAEATKSVVEALRDFHASAPWPEERKTRAHFVSRAQSAAALVARLYPAVARVADAIARWIAATPVVLGEAPVHCDIKVEHLVLLDRKVAFLDLDSHAVADPLYDLAMLEVRIAMHGAAQRCPPDTADRACQMVRSAAAESGNSDALGRYGWLKACAALQLARHFAQNAGAEPERMVRAALALAEAGRAVNAAQSGKGRQGRRLPTQSQPSNREIVPCVSS